MCPKSQIDGQNHKNTGVIRAIFPKRPSRRARPSKDGRVGNTGKTFFLCPKKRTKLHWGEGGVSDKKEAKCDIHRYAPFLRQVNKSTYFGMKINFQEFFS